MVWFDSFTRWFDSNVEQEWDLNFDLSVALYSFALLTRPSVADQTLSELYANWTVSECAAERY